MKILIVLLFSIIPIIANAKDNAIETYDGKTTIREYYSGDIEKTVRIDEITGIKVVLEKTPKRSHEKELIYYGDKLIYAKSTIDNNNGYDFAPILIEKNNTALFDYVEGNLLERYNGFRGVFGFTSKVRENIKKELENFFAGSPIVQNTTFEFSCLLENRKRKHEKMYFSIILDFEDTFIRGTGGQTGSKAIDAEKAEKVIESICKL